MSATTREGLRRKRKAREEQEPQEDAAVAPQPSASSEAGTVTECTICMEPNKTDQGVLPCQHSFCFACINTWSERENSCPLCKQRFRSIKRVQETLDKKQRTRLRSRQVKVRIRNQAPPALPAVAPPVELFPFIHFFNVYFGNMEVLPMFIEDSDDDGVHVDMAPEFIDLLDEPEPRHHLYDLAPEVIDLTDEDFEAGSESAERVTPAVVTTASAAEEAEVQQGVSSSSAPIPSIATAAPTSSSSSSSGSPRVQRRRSLRTRQPH